MVDRKEKKRRGKEKELGRWALKNEEKSNGKGKWKEWKGAGRIGEGEKERIGGSCMELKLMPRPGGGGGRGG
jgi:hypothetical protein